MGFSKLSTLWRKEFGLRKETLILTCLSLVGCKVSVKESFSNSKNDIPNLWTHQPSNLCIDKFSTDDLNSFLTSWKNTPRNDSLTKDSSTKEEFAIPQLPGDLMLISQSQHDAHLSPWNKHGTTGKYIYQKPCYNTIRCDQSIKIKQKKPAATSAFRGVFFCTMGITLSQSVVMRSEQGLGNNRLTGRQPTLWAARNREKILNSHGKLVGGFNRLTLPNPSLASFNHELHYSYLIGGWTNPFETLFVKLGIFPKVGVKIEKYLKPPPSRSHGKDPKVTEMMPFGIAIKYQISTKSIRNGSTSQNIKMVRCVACLTLERKSLLQTCFWHTTCSSSPSNPSFAFWKWQNPSFALFMVHDDSYIGMCLDNLFPFKTSFGRPILGGLLYSTTFSVLVAVHSVMSAVKCQEVCHSGVRVNWDQLQLTILCPNVRFWCRHNCQNIYMESYHISV